ncbi:hypothetical protein FDA94_20915 [Herbidospora galbida]|uniref:Zinc ribbon domain-containing protein n=1 Tax=Herbidospora galbida TaxID=2575442 RepID=A0A4U3MBI4_9ACTN|nr:hypothetical protein [Herbidospora galbida]TKK86568.1 hypothetical protein FDA94_20915 [Herbidospora galbida]
MTGPVVRRPVETLRGRLPVTVTDEHRVVCPRCGTTSTPALLSSRCPACETPIVRELGGEVRPGAVVPFAVDRRHASTALDRWAAALWFAPESLGRVSDAASMRATFLPAWVFDLETVTRYAGRRGDHYYRIETDDDGRSRQVRRTRWTYARGKVGRRFTDVVVPGVRQLKTGRLPAATVPFRAEYLSGVETPRYTVPPDLALDQAKTSVKPRVRAACLADIGGDDRRLHSVVTTYPSIDGDLVLLPYWTGTYLLGGKTWRFTVDGATGEVCGRRPYSAAKLTAPLVVLALVVLVAVLVLLSR